MGYIECVCATKGENGSQFGDLGSVISKRHRFKLNRSKYVLTRITSLIDTKQKRFFDYAAEDWFDSSKSRIIAVNTSIFSNVFTAVTIQNLVMQILYGIGCQGMHFDFSINNVIKDNYKTNNYDDIAIKYSNGIKLSLNYFSFKEYRNISAVILINNSINREIDRQTFILFINPYADIPIEKSLLSGINFFELESVDNNYQYFKWYNT